MAAGVGIIFFLCFAVFGDAFIDQAEDDGICNHACHNNQPDPDRPYEVASYGFVHLPPEECVTAQEKRHQPYDNQQRAADSANVTGQCFGFSKVPLFIKAGRPVDQKMKKKAGADHRSQPDECRGIHFVLYGCIINL